jgi:hypothetical protein
MSSERIERFSEFVFGVICLQDISTMPKMSGLRCHYFHLVVDPRYVYGLRYVSVKKT